MTRLWQFWQGDLKSAFSEKVQRGNHRKFSKNRLNSSPRLKGPKALWRKLNYTLIKMHFKCKNWKRFRNKQWLQRCPNGQVMAIIPRSPQTRIFCKSAKGGRKKNFQISPKKQPSFERHKNTLAQMALSSYQYAIKGQRLEKILGQKSGFKSARMSKLCKCSQGHPKPAFSKKVQTGDQQKFVKNRSKRSPGLKGPKAQGQPTRIQFKTT